MFDKCDDTVFEGSFPNFNVTHKKENVAECITDGYILQRKYQKLERNA